MSTDTLGKEALDKIIKKSRVHLYKPIQIAEILYYHRKNSQFDLNDMESYRNLSKKWRDEVSMLLVRRKSTLSQKFHQKRRFAILLGLNLRASSLLKIKQIHVNNFTKDQSKDKIRK